MSGDVTLTHDMAKRNGVWTCVHCGRAGTIREINRVRCPRQDTSPRTLLDAVGGTGKFGKKVT